MDCPSDSRDGNEVYTLLISYQVLPKEYEKIDKIVTKGAEYNLLIFEDE